MTPDVKMSVSDIKKKIENEKSISSRYPLRLIFVEDMSSYKEIKSFLFSFCSLTINLGDDDICKGEDLYPDFEALQHKISNSKDVSILLLSMGEYLRFRISKEKNQVESKFLSLWKKQQSAESFTRVFILMFGAKELFDTVVPYIDERQIDHIWQVENTHKDTNYNLSVFPLDFETTFPRIISGLRDWLLNWETYFFNSNDAIVTTKLILNMENQNGVINVNIIDNFFEYVKNNIIDGNILKKDWFLETEWLELVKYLEKGVLFEKTIFKAINVNAMDIISSLSQWHVYSILQKKLVWIWCQLNNADSYCGIVIKQSKSINNIITNIRDYIVQTKKSEWISDRNKAVSLIREMSFDDEYFKLLDTLPNPEQKFELLTYTKPEESIYALRLISSLLRQGFPKETIKEMLNGKFNLFELYFFHDIEGYADINNYLHWYKHNKIINVFPSMSMPYIDFYQYKSRYSILSQYDNDDTFMLWVDGMGVEWLSLLYNLLKEKIQEGELLKPQITCACLPTETEFNRQWENFKSKYKKIDRLDNLNHKGLPDDEDFFSCFLSQLNIIAGIVNEIASILPDYKRVLITSDHGSSRLAALAFHSIPGYSLPQGFISKSFGRYCEVPKEKSDNFNPVNAELKKIDEQTYLIIKNHEHFSIPGKAASKDHATDELNFGEIHGGMTPEEYLVPIIVIENKSCIKQKLKKIKFEKDIVYKEGNTITLKLISDSNIDSLESSIGKFTSICEKITNNIWEIKYSTLELGEYFPSIIINGNLLKEKLSFKIKAKGITTNDLFGGI